MSSDVKSLYGVTALHGVVLLLALLLPYNAAHPFLIAAIQIVTALLSHHFIKKQSPAHLRHREAALVLAAAALAAVVLFYLSGLKFGFTKTSVTGNSLLLRALPIAVSIAAGELVRRRLLATGKQGVAWISFFSFVLADVRLFTQGSITRSYTTFVSAVGLVLLPAIARNALCHLVCAEHGAIATIPHRLILSLYAYLIPASVDFPPALLAFLRILYPLVLLFFIRKLYQKRAMTVSKKRVFISSVCTVLTVALMLLGVCFLAGLFPHRLIVVASDSMKEEMARGDAVVYEAYDGQLIEVGEIILFRKGQTTVIHRVVEIKKINGVYRYYTKGDANDSLDTGYITNADLIGIVTQKIKYVGYPTVWLHDLFR